MSKDVLRHIVREIIVEIKMGLGSGGFDSNNDIVNFHGYPSGYSQFPHLYVDTPDSLPNKEEVNKNNEKIIDESSKEVSYETFESGDEFYEYISKNGLNGEIDPRFLLKRDGGEGRFKYFHYNDYKIESKNVKVFAIKEGDIIVGIAHIRKSSHRENTWFLSYMSIDLDFSNKGYATLLTKFMLKWFKENNITFETSSYSEEGFLKLKPLFNKMAIKYGVDFIDKRKL